MRYLHGILPNLESYRAVGKAVGVALQKLSVRACGGDVVGDGWEGSKIWVGERC